MDSDDLCRARLRDGGRCPHVAIWNGRCKTHAGGVPPPTTGERLAYEARTRVESDRGPELLRYGPGVVIDYALLATAIVRAAAQAEGDVSDCHV